jgi:diaminopimelate epimerase
VIGTVVYKMTGSGNDFVFVDGRWRAPGAWTAEQIRVLCDRQRGVGADGFVVVEPGSGPDAVRFHFFNRDGARAAMCGNGALCATRIAARLELANPGGMVLETDAGVYRSRCLDGPGELAELVLGDLPAPSAPQVALGRGERQAYLALVGVPHLVVLVDDVGGTPVQQRGRALRFDPALGAAGANVNFLGTLPGGGWAMRTYERGVEGETLACGTGAVACASVLALSDRGVLPLELRTASGRCLGVAGCAEGGVVRQAALRGEGRMVFCGVVGDVAANS